MNFAENLKQIIKDRHLKQASLCRMTGIQTSLMSEYLQGKKSPTIGNAIAIADALKVSLDFLVGKSIDTNISSIHRQVIRQLEPMTSAQLKATLAFIKTLKELYTSDNDGVFE